MSGCLKVWGAPLETSLNSQTFVLGMCRTVMMYKEIRWYLLKH